MERRQLNVFADEKLDYKLPAVHGSERAAFERRAALAVVNVDHDRALSAERFQGFQDGQAHRGRRRR
jgi:hypothetical protein